jgi:hypothetical protein
MRKFAQITFKILFITAMMLVVISCEKKKATDDPNTSGPYFGSGTLNSYGGNIVRTHTGNGEFDTPYHIIFDNKFHNTGISGTIKIKSGNFEKSFPVKKDSTYKLTVYFDGSIKHAYSTVTGATVPIYIDKLIINYSAIKWDYTDGIPYVYYSYDPLYVTDATFLVTTSK